MTNYYVPLNIKTLICSKGQVETASIVTYTDFKTTE